MYYYVKTALSLGLLSCWATSFADQTAVAQTLAAIPRFDHVVIVLMENENQEQIIGNPNAPPATIPI